MFPGNSYDVEPLHTGKRTFDTACLNRVIQQGKKVGSAWDGMSMKT